ncbi:MAG: flagellar biosynthesis protein FlgJ [Alphaproteobacteria bacterium]|nr:flagellar biosynthesis protein FlgJ [Alphaproteobacteria bacterium]
MNTIQNNMLENITAGAPRNILHAIKHASAKTGVNFAYMVKQAAAESSFNPVAKAKTSSASGLYQFIESTWLNMIEKHGSQYGIETEGKSREELLALRNDPKTASFMAAAFASENERFLDAHWGGKVGETELYFAHFMGAGGAAAFLKAKDDNPMQEAALLFPKAAKANRNVFYDSQTGRARTLDEVYSFFDKKFSGGAVESAPEPAKLKQGIESPAFVAANQPAYNALTYKTISRPSGTLGAIPFQRLVHSPVEIMLLAQLSLPGIDSGQEDNNAYNNMFERENSLYRSVR